MKNLLDYIYPRICYFSFGLKTPFYFHYLLPTLVLYKYLVKFLKSKYFRLIVISIPSIIVLIRLLRNDSFFLSDDFAHLYFVSENSFLGTIKAALSEGGIWVGHRIVVGFWLFKLIFMAFGTQIEPYLFAIFIFNLLNVLLLYLILERIKKGSLFSVLSAFIFGTFYLSWISNIHEIVAGTFLLLGLYLWFVWLSSRKARIYWLVLVFYLLAISTKEISFLFPSVLVAVSVFYHHYISRINLKKLTVFMAPFFLVLLLYSSTLASGFLGYFSLSSGKGYSMSFSPEVILKNLLHYTTSILPIVNFSMLGLGIFFASFVLFDLWKKKPITTPFLFSYLIFLGPPLLFEGRQAPYYFYIPSLFLFIGFFVFLKEIYFSLRGLFKKKSFLTKAFTIYFVLFVACGIFGVDKFLLDNCFLIQFPWGNRRKTTLSYLTKRLDKLFDAGKIQEDTEVKLEEKEAIPEITFIINSNVLHLFLSSKGKQDYRFSYNEEEKFLVVDKIND